MLNGAVPTHYGGGSLFGIYLPDTAKSSKGIRESQIKNAAKFAILGCLDYPNKNSISQHMFLYKTQFDCEVRPSSVTEQRHLKVDIHGDSINLAFADGHVESFAPAAVTMKVFMLYPEKGWSNGTNVFNY